MNDKENLSKKLTIVGMDDVQISTLDKHIIGTYALATCTGVLIYSKKEKRAIVAHISSNYESTLNKIFKLIVENKLYRDDLRYAIIPGTDIRPHEYYGIINVLENHFKDYIHFDYKELSNEAVRLDKNTYSNEFAFDALKGIFVTDKVSFGINYNANNRHK